MSVIYNGTNLETKYGMVCLGRGTYGAPARDIEQIHVPGRNGDLLIDNGGYLNFDITYPECTIQEDFPSQARKLRNFLLSNPGYHKLVDSYNQGFYRQAEFRGPFAAEAHTARDNMSSVFDLTFNCKPLRYLDAGSIKLYLAGQPQYSSYRTEIPYLCDRDTCNISITNSGSTAKTIKVVDLTAAVSTEYTATAAAGDSASISISNANGKIFIVNIPAPADDLDISIRINSADFYKYSNGTTVFRNGFLKTDGRIYAYRWGGTIAHGHGSFSIDYNSYSTMWFDTETYAAGITSGSSPTGSYFSGKPPVLDPGAVAITVSADQTGTNGVVYLEPRFCIL